MADQLMNRGITSFLALAVALSACSSEPPTVPSPSRGALRVLVRTTGATLDDNGYTLRVGSSDVALAVQDSLDLRDLSPGPLPLALTDVAANCRILSLPSSATIEVSQRTRVVVEMSCDSALRNVILFDRIGSPPAVWMMRPDGSGKTQFLAKASVPALTPDGSHVIFHDWDTGKLSISRVDKTRRWTVVPALLTGQSQPDVSPDSRSLVFTTYTSDGPWHIYRANIDGSDIRQLTATDQVDQDPRWSPDGRFITFTRHATDPNIQLFIIPADGGEAVPVTAKGEGCCARWSPDGSRILFAYPSGGGLWTMASDGTGAARLDVVPGYSTSAEWSPDGASILLEAGGQLWRVALDGTDFAVIHDEGYATLGRWHR
jgi:Tol biopolymer transport system component